MGEEMLTRYREVVQRELEPGGAFSWQRRGRYHDARTEDELAGAVANTIGFELQGLSQDAQNYLARSMVEEWGLVGLQKARQQQDEEEQFRQAIAASEAEEQQRQAQQARQQHYQPQYQQPLLQLPQQQYPQPFL